MKIKQNYTIWVVVIAVLLIGWFIILNSPQEIPNTVSQEIKEEADQQTEEVLAN